MLANYDARVQDKKLYSKGLLLFFIIFLYIPDVFVPLPRSGVREDHTASYFSHDNADATRSRDQLASDSLEMLIQWLKDGGNVGIHGILTLLSSHDVYH
jgi:hypothetical protein